jgi:pilus assembly protein CpaE
LDLLNFPKSRRILVLNRADDKVGLTPEKVETTLDMKIGQAIPTSPEVANATNAGEPITASHPKHLVSQAIRRLAENLGGPVNPTLTGQRAAQPAKANPKTEAPARRGLLRRGR